MRLFFKITGSIAILFILPLLILELVVGFWYKNEIVDRLKILADESLESSIYFSDIGISTLPNFPHLTISIKNLSIRESGYEILKTEKIALHADLMDLYHENYSLSKIEILKPRFYAPIDSTGKKFMLRIKKKEEAKPGAKLLLDIPKIEIRDALIIVENAYKKNRVRISVDQGNFRLKSFDDLLEFKGDAVGVLDTMISRGNLNQTAVPIAAHQATFRVNTLDDKKLFDGILQLYNAQLRAYGLLKPTGNGNLLDITLEGDEARINDYLALIPQFKPLKLVQHNPDAQLTLTIRNSGFVDPVTFPNVDILFELRNAAFTRIGLSGIMDSVSFRGRFTNGKERNAKTSEMVIDFGHAKVKNSFFQIKGSISNFEDPYLNIDASSELELADLKNLLNYPDVEMSGSIKILADVDGKISELEKQGRSRRNTFNGYFKFDNINIRKKASNIKVENLSGGIGVKNKELTLSALTARFNDAKVRISGSTRNFFPLFEKKPGKTSFANLYINIDGLSVSQSDIKAFSNSDQGKANPKAFEFPPFLHLNCDVNMKEFSYEDYHAESIKLKLALNNDSLSIATSHFKLAEGDLWLGAVSRPSANTINNYNIWVKADLNHLDTKNYLSSKKSESNKEVIGSRDYSNYTIHTDIQLKNLKHNKIELSNLRILADLKEGKLKAKTFNFDFPFGKTQSSLEIDLKDSVYQVSGNSKVALHAFNIDSLKKYYNTLRPKQSSEDSLQNKKPSPFSVDRFIFHVSAPSATYQQFKINSLDANLHVRENRLRLAKSSFEMFDGVFEIDGLIRKNEAHEVKAFCNLSASNINLGDITSNVVKSKNEMFSEQHFKGNVGVSGQILLKYNHELVHQEDEMLGKVNISLSHGELIRFKPITESLKFIKQSNRDTIFLANPNLEVLFHNDEIVLPTTTFKSSLSNIEFSGYHSTEFDFGFDLQISVSDLLFKSQKKKRKEVNNEEKARFGLIKHYLQARTVDGKLQIESMKKKDYHDDLYILKRRYDQVDSTLNQMSLQIVQ
ncbi:MAG: DUF3971 domain-containing protein [Reichenbachiella sp.]|uniref:YhdP family protein n=1 Tax=Reichenbachiella sp. TaxID=2184521 RepID=UPI0029663F8F|nr:DUF3971 domain-containing protein [Reichenbachiella sp.]MDW3208527.1 DUF3971 domain-containing protein [Reichenbachiella sp.]